MTTPKKKTWCRHIVVERLVQFTKPEKTIHYRYKFEPADITVTDDWKLCPICGKERPKG